MVRGTLEARVGPSPDSPTDMSTVVTARKERAYPGRGGVSGRRMAAHTDDNLFETEITDCVCRSCLGLGLEGERGEYQRRRCRTMISVTVLEYIFPLRRCRMITCHEPVCHGLGVPWLATARCCNALAEVAPSFSVRGEGTVSQSALGSCLNPNFLGIARK
jgi:hypothetical protein